MISVSDIKQKALNFPDDGKVNDLLNEMLLLYKVNCGLDDVKAGRVLSKEEFEKEVNSWLYEN